jgi:tRNA (cmo5U34)-methyltransferase
MTANDNAKDRLFAEQKLPGDFVFDDKVASVFDDMIQRSVPGYSTIIAMIGVLAERYCQPDSRVYDLGCSLGGATYAIAHYVAHQHYSIIDVDNSTSMIQRLRARLQQDRPADIEIDCRFGGSA